MSYRAVDTNILADVDVDLDTFQVFIEKVNLIVDHMQNTVVTVSNTSAYDGNNTGNGFVFGIFGANNLVATNSLRGGNVSTSGLLTITSETKVTNSVTIDEKLTVLGLSNVYTLDVRGSANVANVLNVTGNTTLQSTLTVTGNTNLNNYVNIKTDYTVDVSANANLGANISSPQEIYSFPKASFSSAKIMLQTKQGSNIQFLEAALTHNNGEPLMAVYAVVANPAGANNGLISATANTTHIRVRYTQTAANTSTKTIIHMVK